MKKKTVEECLNNFLEEHKDLFKSLAEKAICPACRKFISPPFYNLGDTYHSFEGCLDCYEKIKKDKV